jgi:hypothetical protein
MMARSETLEHDLKECGELFGLDLCALTDECTLSLSEECQISFDASSYPCNTTLFLLDDYKLTDQPIRRLLGSLEVALAVLPHAGLSCQHHGDFDDGLLEVSISVDILDCDELFLKCWGVFDKESIVRVHLDYEIHEGSLVHTAARVELNNVTKTLRRAEARKLKEEQEKVAGATLADSLGNDADEVGHKLGILTCQSFIFFQRLWCCGRPLKVLTSRYEHWPHLNSCNWPTVICFAGQTSQTSRTC